VLYNFAFSKREAILATAKSHLNKKKMNVANQRDTVASAFSEIANNLETVQKLQHPEDDYLS
jgi:hypothetical protein